MEISYTNVRNKIGEFLKLEALTSQEKNDLVNFHREIECYNARKIIADQDDQQMKDVQFLIKSSIFLVEYGNPRDWKLQLEAAVGILSNCS